MRSLKFRIYADNPKGFLYYEFIPTMGFILKGARLEDQVEIGEEYAQQFTGIKDKNGKEIYEGDILSYDEKMDEHGDKSHQIAWVQYNSVAGAFGIGRSEIWNFFYDFGLSDIKVIGNIYENPELLK